MELKFETIYYVNEQSYKGAINVGDTLMREVKEWLEGNESVDEDDILEAILDIMMEDNSPEKLVNPKDRDNLDYIDEIDIINTAEVVEYFSRLLRGQTCCSKAPWGSNFCPTCGKKLRSDAIW